MDFQQGLITTIHEYGVTKDLLKELNKSLKKRSTAILIPCLYEEFERPALRDIKEVLKIVSEINPDAYVTTEPTNPTKLTGNRK